MIISAQLFIAELFHLARTPCIPKSAEVWTEQDDILVAPAIKDKHSLQVLPNSIER